MALTSKEKLKRELKKLLDLKHILWFVESIFIRLIIPLINILSKKESNSIAFTSYPDFADNAKSLWDYINAETQLKTIWLVNDQQLALEMNKKGIKTYLFKSFSGRLAMSKCKYLVCTHDQFINSKTKNQVLINLWHGIPIKRIASLDLQKKGRKRKIDHKIDYLVVTSDLMRYVFSSCFQLDIDKIIVKGQPRCDKLFASNGKKVLSGVLGEDLSQYHKIILYAPTFRNTPTGRSDGQAITENIFRLEDYNHNLINSFLKDEKILLVTKLHPHEEVYYHDKNLPLPENCKLLHQKDLSSKWIGLYDVLNAFDILITDYSSIYLDYLLLNRPIIFLQTDIESYQQKRGFLFENFDFWMPGEKAYQLNDLITAIKNCTENDNYQTQRKLVNDLVNERRENICKDIVEDLIS